MKKRPVNIDAVTDELSYLKEKNQLVFNVTGEILIPEDQLVAHTVPNVQCFQNFHLLSAWNCTYCSLYRANGCKDCPMYLAGNSCLREHYNSIEEWEERSTYQKCNRKWYYTATPADKQQLLDLGKKLRTIIEKR